MKMRETLGNFVGIVTTRKWQLLIYVGTFEGCKCSYVVMMKTTTVSSSRVLVSQETEKTKP